MPLELLIPALAIVAVFALIVGGFIAARQRRKFPRGATRAERKELAARRRSRALDTAPPWTPPDTTDPFAAWEDLFDPQSRRYHR